MTTQQPQYELCPVCEEYQCLIQPVKHGKNWGRLFVSHKECNFFEFVDMPT
jgi:hypothetical protein